MCTAHSSLSATHLLPGELAGEAEAPSLPKAVLPLHFPAQAHRGHHCSACSRGKVMQASRTCLRPAGKSPKETASPVPTYTDQKLSVFWLSMHCSLLFAFSNLNTSFLLLINTILGYSDSNFHWITSHLRQSPFLLGLEAAYTGGDTPDQGWSPGMQTPDSIAALQNMVPSAQTSKWNLVC